jgi:hypothetical protein
MTRNSAGSRGKCDLGLGQLPCATSMMSMHLGGLVWAGLPCLVFRVVVVSSGGCNI